MGLISERLKALLQIQLARFILVGIIGVGIDAFCYSSLILLDLPIAVSKLSGFVIGSIYAYLMNWRFTFKSQNNKWSIVIFILVYSSSMLFNVFGNALFISLFSTTQFPLFIAFFITTSITTIWNYLWMSRVVFKSFGN